MSSFFLANYYNGIDSEKRFVKVAIEEDAFVIANQDHVPAFQRRVPISDCVIDTPLTANELTITLPDSERLEVF